ncbi:MAG: hypothetical protein J6P16_01805 [Eubacterium sp.]|nr:hypothetical protein [Eubacterium sp.]
MYKFLKKEATTCVNGIFILVVFISHLRSYMSLPHIMDKAMLAIGQLMVAMFLFYSGYGVMESISKKGMSYVKKIPYRRVLGVLAMFVPAVLVYAAMDLILGIEFGLDRFLLSLVAWESIGNSNWYIFVILCLYIITWAAWLIADMIMAGHRRHEKKQTDALSEKDLIPVRYDSTRDSLGLIFTIIFSAGLIILLKLTKAEYYYNTISAYLFGIFFSQNKDHMLRVCGFNSDGKIKGLKACTSYVLMTGMALVSTLLLRMFLRLEGHDYVFLVMTVFFCLAVVLLSYLLPFPDHIFKWIGEHLFEIYILMRIPMTILLRIPGWENGGLSYVLMCLSITIFLAWGYHALINKVKTSVF